MKFALRGRAAYAYTGGKHFDPALPCVVFIHGALHDHSVWTLLARYFAHHGRSVLAVDLPGHGRSEGPPLADVEALGSWILELLGAAGVPTAALVGHSMGSLIALEAAAQQPLRCERLVMVGTAWPMKVSEQLLNTSRDQPQAAMAMVNAFSHTTLAAKPAVPGPGTWLHGANLALMERMQASGAPHGNLFLHDFQVCDRYEAASAAAQRLKAAAHLILGTRDAMTPPKSARQLQELLNAQVQTVTAGHALMAEAPEALLTALKAALA
ncbi:Pimeloyl-ACP methyl ester carboxylesterase [Roseateles sp. YR242]|uniref:alpha/beta fold hydrolase n=1 Tax=Roseateles sp. YR242 TaxID=1855305 RepID=UPI0008B26C6E|nr:alpha/beta hydrolase [Roseateles sp. YR242]SEL63593.1 Pimeloyl-ACP methyl ester carboxylesterase [Roseateles sp. YR242]